MTRPRRFRDQFNCFIEGFLGADHFELDRLLRIPGKLLTPLIPGCEALLRATTPDLSPLRVVRTTAAGYLFRRETETTLVKRLFSSARPNESATILLYKQFRVRQSRKAGAFLTLCFDPRSFLGLWFPNVSRCYRFHPQTPTEYRGCASHVG
jgi:hypothetical protein